VSVKVTTAAGAVLLTKTFDTAPPVAPVVLSIKADNLMYSKTTQLTMTGGTYKGDFIAKGTVMPSGLFEADAGRSNMTLAGGLAGNPADQAAYIFSGRIDANTIAGGGTFWRKAP
jgi:hypothetical protein